MKTISGIMGTIGRLLGRSDIYVEGDLYMRRWRIGPRKWYGVRLHHIVRSDSDREFHDHPFAFVSVILLGGYTEHRPDRSPRRYRPGGVIFRRAEDLHRLELDRPAWTLVIRGPIRRVWGFLADDGWIPWTEHVARRRRLAGSEADPSSHVPYIADSSI